MKIAVKKMLPNAHLPSYGSEFSAGADLYAVCEEPVSIAPGETKLLHTGLAMEIPEGYGGFLYARSGLAVKSGLAPANKVGVIDADYRGEVMVALYNHSSEIRTVADGESVLPEAEKTVTVTLRDGATPTLLEGDATLKKDGDVYRLTVPGGGFAFIRF